jgi:PAS domain S-box-containing protein
MLKEIRTIEGLTLKDGKDFSPAYLSQLEDFFVNAPVGMMILDNDGAVMRMSGALLEMLGIDTEALVQGRDFASLFTGSAARDALAALTDSEMKANNVVAEIVRKDGGKEEVYLDINVEWQAEGISHSRWFVRPIRSRVLPSFERDADKVLELPDDEQRRRFALLSDFFESAPAGVHFVGLNGLILKANMEEKRLLGYGETPEQYDGIHVSKIHWDKKKIELLLTRLAESVPVIDEKAFMHKKQGDIVVVRIYSGLRLKGGKFENTRCFLFADPDQNQEPVEMQEYTFPSFEV